MPAIFALEFSLYSNMLQANLSGLRNAISHRASRDIIEELRDQFLVVVEDTKMSKLRWPNRMGEDWDVDPIMMGKVLYREAAGCRLIGGKDMLDRAQWAINLALETVPGDKGMLAEKKAIEAALKGRR